MKHYNIVLSEEVFPGFYNTVYDYSNMEEIETDEDVEIDVENYIERVCNNIFNYIKEVIPFKVISYKLNSPKQYNYRNDYIELVIETTPEDILFEAVNFDREDVFSYVCFSEYNDDQYHEALLEELITHYCFINEESLEEKFIYE